MLEGTASNRDAVGTRVSITVSGRTQIAARFGGGSYQSASDPRLHFGLGPANKADRVEVAWPSGRRDCFQGLAADTGYWLIEGSREPRPMAGFSSPTTQASNSKPIDRPHAANCCRSAFPIFNPAARRQPCAE